MRLTRIDVCLLSFTTLAAFVGAESVRSDGSSAGPAAMLTNVETGPPVLERASRAFGHVEFHGATYFTATDRAHGFELWRSDGSEAGTSLLIDLLPGTLGSLPRELTVVGERLYFTAFDGLHGFGLWSSDGTADGTRLLKGAEGDFLRPGQLTAYGAMLLFTAGPHDRPALWRSDGTSVGTQKVLDLAPSDERLGFAAPRLPGVVSLGQAWFMSRAGHKRVLWRTDGSAGGTTRVWTDTLPIPWQYFPTYDLYVAFPGGLLFRGSDQGRDALWRSDGTPAGTYPLAHAPLGEFLAADWFARLGPFTYFLARPREDFGAQNGGDTLAYSLGFQEAWRTDGTVAGTARFARFEGTSKVQQLTAAAGRLFLVGGGEILSSDGWVADWSHALSASRPQLVATQGGAFVVDNIGVVLADGLPGGSQLLSAEAVAGSLSVVGSSIDARTWPLGMHTAATCLPSACWFRGQHSESVWSPRSIALWRSDLTPAGTRRVLPESGRDRGSWPDQFVSFGGDAYFTTTGAFERDPWQHTVAVRLLKASAGGVSVVAQRPDLPCDSSFWPDRCRIRFLTALPGAMLYFDPQWFAWLGTQGDPGGAWRVEPQSYSWYARRGVGAINGRVLAVDFVNSRLDLVAVDVKEGDVALDAPPEAVGSVEDVEDMQFTAVGNWLYFTFGDRLWKTDGTPGSVQLVKALSAADLTDVGGLLFFVSDGMLWKSDGSEAGTVAVAPVEGAVRLTAVGSRLFFAASDPAHGEELWTSDGSAAGTHLLADVRPGPGSSRPDAPAAMGTRLIFSADDGVRGRELWRWDPRSGASLVADIVPGPLGSLAAETLVVAAGSRVYFPAWTPSAGVELWSSDGATAELVQDISPGAAGSHPRELTALDGRLYFSADDGVHGQEPWSLPLP